MESRTRHKPAISNHTIRDFLLLISAPLTILLLVALFVYIPSALAKPSYDFIYRGCETSYGCNGIYYTVNDDGVVTVKGKSQSYQKNSEAYTGGASLYYFDVSENTYKKISLETAQKYKLDDSQKSPDGYTLVVEKNTGKAVFYGSANTGWYLNNGVKKKQINMGIKPYNFTSDTFVGWVLPQ